MKIVEGSLLAALFTACIALHGQSAEMQHSSPIVAIVDAPAHCSAELRSTNLACSSDHIGPLIYRSLWSEMLDDRKFYFPINSKPEESHRAGGFPGMQLRKWRPLGPDDAIAMDKDHPFVGDQSPRIALNATTPHGIRQSGLALLKGKRYFGHIYLSGASGATVQVDLIWGEGANDRQTVRLGPLTTSFKSFRFTFDAQAATESAAFEISGTGSGSFHVGAVSLMPADNMQGFRPDTIALLRQVHSGFWRLPGGNFLSDWNWYESVGERDKRSPMFDYAWNAMQTNDVGLDEFMTFCKLIGTEPYITVNAGFGDARSAAEEVEYMRRLRPQRLGRSADAQRTS